MVPSGRETAQTCNSVPANAGLNPMPHRRMTTSREAHVSRLPWRWSWPLTMTTDDLPTGQRGKARSHQAWPCRHQTVCHHLPPIFPMQRCWQHDHVSGADSIHRHAKHRWEFRDGQTAGPAFRVQVPMPRRQVTTKTGQTSWPSHRGRSLAGSLLPCACNRRCDHCAPAPELVCLSGQAGKRQQVH